MKSESIRKNMLMNILLTSSNFIFPLLTYTHVARVLLSDGTGKVAFSQSIITYFLYIAALGIPGYGIRECAKVRDDRKKLSKLVSELFAIELIATIISYIILGGAIVFWEKLQSYRLLLAIMSISILLQTIGIEWLYNALEKYTYIAIRSMVFKGVSVLLTYGLVRDKSDLIFYGIITVFSSYGSYILNFINVRKYVDLEKVEFSNLRKHMGPILTFFMSSVVITIYSSFDTIMLGVIKNDSAVGMYNAAMKMKSIVLSVSTAITSVLIPRMSMFYAKKEKRQFNELLVKSLQISLVLMIPLSFLVILNAQDVLLFVCGEGYLAAKNTLIILMLCCVFLMMTNIIGNQILIPTGNEKRYSQSVFIGMWINLALNTVLIPSYSSAGAAFATLVTEAFNMIWMGLACWNRVLNTLKNTRLKIYVIALGGSCIIELLFRRLYIEFTLIFRLGCGAMIFLGTYYILLIIYREPIVNETIISFKKCIAKVSRYKEGSTK